MSERESRLTMTVVEAAQALGISRNSAYLGVKVGDIPSIRVGRRIMIPRAAFNQKFGDAPTEKKGPIMSDRAATILAIGLVLATIVYAVAEWWLWSPVE